MFELILLMKLTDVHCAFWLVVLWFVKDRVGYRSLIGVAYGLMVCLCIFIFICDTHRRIDMARKYGDLRPLFVPTRNLKFLGLVLDFGIVTHTLDTFAASRADPLDAK